MSFDRIATYVKGDIYIDNEFELSSAQGDNGRFKIFGSCGSRVTARKVAETIGVPPQFLPAADSYVTWSWLIDDQCRYVEGPVNGGLASGYAGFSGGNPPMGTFISFASGSSQ
jgi:hypothetical protein